MDDAGLDGPAGCEALVVSQPLRRQSKGLFADNRRHRYFDPFVSGPFVTATFVPMTARPDKRNGLVTFCLGPVCVLLKQAVPL